MRADGVADAAIETFRDLYGRWQAGETGMLPEAEIEPLHDVPSLEDLEDAESEALDQTVVLKLNGGLGTSMGMTKAKSLLEVKDGLTFLDIIARQILEARSRLGARLPLVLMNSFATRDDSLAALQRWPDLASDVPADFVQSKEPKIRRGRRRSRWSGPTIPRWSGRRPATATSTPRSSAPGCSTRCSSAATATCSCRTPTTSARCSTRGSSPGSRARRFPFLSEVADRTEADRKGGHLAVRRSDGGLVLRETAQVPDEDADAFSGRLPPHYFNTNNLWVDLHALRRVMDGARRRAGAADDRQPQDGRPQRLRLGAGGAARDGDGRGGRASSRVRARCACRGRASRR